ncbi:breast carcinoma-amplified sequence 1 homolog isoform X2 [Microcaecilia unicolor]|uniref:Breast carcinoma-amplified sequence 1 isoform X2 n=1 Tax=Microcaecilia unicolor TaxID=1415580 RepID=A0A6P7YNY0_9AMPH|nr:breast carcinoma-amplified sequence 1 isoform X2 [Microcaecilia unicolor]
MGNEISVHEDSENQENEFSAEDAKHASVNGNLQNGSITIHHVETVSLQRNDVVDTNANIKQNNVDPSSQKTMEIMSVSEENEKSPGNEAKPATPATKSFFRIMLSRPAPGRTKEPTGDSAAGTEKSDGNSAKLLVNNAPSESLKSPETAVLNESSDKGPNQALNSTALNVGQPNVTEPEPPQPEDTASKPKEISLFDKLFKPERARENTKAQPNLSQEINTAPKQDPNLTVQDVSGLQQNSVLPEQNIDVDSQSVVQLQSSATFSSPSEEDLKESRAKEENSKAAASPENNPVMSFFKTLVTPKSLPKPEDEPKSDSEDKKRGNGTCKRATLPKIGILASKREKAKGGQPVLQQKTETPAKTSPESPKAGKSAFRRLFGLKSAKENQQTTETKRVEEPAVVAIPVKAEKTAPVQIVKQETKTPERAAKEQVPAPSEVQTDGPQKPSKESAPRAKLFWKKPAKEVPPPSAPKENTVAEPEVQIVVQQPPVQAAAPSKDVIKTSEGQKAKKSSFMMFFKQLSVSDDGGSTGAEEVNSKDPDHPTLDSTEGSATQKISQKSVAPVIIESQPAGPKGKESAKEKKVTAELHKQKTNKQETKDSQEIASSAQQPLSQPQAIQNGGDPAKDPTLKRTEKRQSFGSFFKGIAPKKTCDAEVQTDPAPILK